MVKTFSMLHIINKSPFNSTVFASCFQMAQPGDAVLFIEDAVVAAIVQSSVAEEMIAKVQELAIYVLQPDLTARGFSEVLPEIKAIDYQGFVALTVQHHPIQTWS